jgi:hypothetical protein
MIPNNNLSVLPWYTSIEQQNARKWWVYNRVYPLFTPAMFMLPFQILLPYRSTPSMSACVLYDARTNVVVDSSVATKLTESGFTFEQFSTLGYTVAVYPGQSPAFNALANGQYYLRITINGVHYFSEIFTVVNDISPYLKIEWWDVENFTMDAGTIVYKYAGGTQFKNVLYLQADIAKPEYPFEEEGETRDGYFFPIKQISEKHYRFSFLASEYLLDVMRLIRMADYAQIEKNGQIYSLDTFLITPDWDDNGDVAAVEAEFDTATVAKKIGVGYIKAQRGDFNDDFNNDYNNQE